MKNKKVSLFILGAGFSKGYNPKKAPLINGFLDIAEKEGYFKPNDMHSELLAFIRKYFGDYHDVNVETLASFLTTELVPDISQKYEYNEKLYKQLVLIIINTLGWLHKHPIDNGVQEIYKNFVYRLVKNNIDVITFNYDLILDNLLNNTTEWSPIMGYGIKMQPAGNIPFIQREIDRHLEIEMEKSKMVYLKLHGSLNWGRSIIPHPVKGDEIVISSWGLKSPEILPIERLTTASSFPTVNKYYETFIIPPILHKEQFYHNPLLQNIWYTAKEAIFRANEIFVIGYSFPSSDFLTEFLFRQSIASPFSVKERKIRIINKSIDEQYKKRVESIFLRSEFEYKQADVIDFLKNYVEE